MAKYTSDDVKYLADCIKASKEKGGKPYAFLLGAGVSKSAGIPLASELLKKIKENPDLNIHLRNLSVEDLKSYPKCMEALTIEDRRTLLETYLKEAKINWANIVIASLLKPHCDKDSFGYIKRLLTFNFDNVLARACGICGYYPATYDFSQTPPNDFDFMSDGAITHLHGQGSGLKMLNSSSETNPQAKALGNLFTDTLAKYNLVVIGYSGLADNAFRQFQKRFENRTRIFWIGYSEEPEEHICKLLKKATKTSSYFGGADADSFLIELANHFNCWPPKLFLEPNEHLLEEIAPIIEYPSDAGADILARLKAQLARSSKSNEATSIDPKVLLFQGKFEEVLRRIPKPETDDEKYAVAWAYVSLGNEFSRLAKLEDEESMYMLSFEQYESALKIDPEHADALNNWGAALLDLGHLSGEERLLKLAIEKCEAALVVKPEFPAALNNYGNALMELARKTDNASLLISAIEKFEAAATIDPEFGAALNNLGAALSELAISTDNESLFEQAIEKFDAALKINPRDASALNNLGNALRRSAERKNDNGLFRQAIEKYEAGLEINARDPKTLNNFGLALSRFATLTDDESLLIKAIEKYDAALAINPKLTFGLTNLGNALLELAKKTNDVLLIERAVEKFEAALSYDPELVNALNGISVALMALGKINESENHFLKALSFANNFEKITSKASYNKACAYALIGKEDECHQQLLKCKADGTLPDLAHLNIDTDMDSVRGKKWFKDLIRELA